MSYVVWQRQFSNYSWKIEKKLESIPIEGDTAKILTSLPPLFGPSEILILYPLSHEKIQCSPHITTWNLMMAVIF